MKRYGDLFEKIVSWENLVEAARMALRGRKRINAARFYFHLETELIRLEDELRSGAYRPLPYRVFEIFEPKRRVISAADIRDRVVHHAICRILEPIFERRAMSRSIVPCRLRPAKTRCRTACGSRLERVVEARRAVTVTAA